MLISKVNLVVRERERYGQLQHKCDCGIRRDILTKTEAGLGSVLGQQVWSLRLLEL
jgi:hypothetical protein